MRRSHLPPPRSAVTASLVRMEAFISLQAGTEETPARRLNSANRDEHERCIIHSQSLFILRGEEKAAASGFTFTATELRWTRLFKDNTDQNVQQLDLSPDFFIYSGQDDERLIFPFQ